MKVPTRLGLVFFPLCCVVAGLIGLAFNAIQLNNLNATYYPPRFLNIWVTLFVLFYSLQILWNLFVFPFRGYKNSIALFVYYFVITIASFIIMVSNYAGYRSDGASWALLLFALNIFNVFICWKRFQHAKKSLNSIQDDEQGSLLPTTPSNPRTRKIILFFAGLNIVLLAVAFLLTLLLIGGSTLQAYGYRTFPPRGQLVDVQSPNGRTSKVMVFCSGKSVNISNPTFLFDIGGGGHSSSDLYDLQFALNDKGYRVCSYDYPGTGWSDPGVDATQPMLLDKIVAAVNEPGPFVLLGTMDGGPTRILTYGLKYPTLVRALVVLDYSPGPAEFETYRLLNNLTTTQGLSYAVSTVSSRFSLGTLIRALIIQWGLMPIFAPATPGGSQYQSEKLYLNIYNEKQWQTQLMYLFQQLQNPTELLGYDDWASNDLSKLPPVLWFLPNVNMTQQCEENHYTEKECQQAVEQNDMSLYWTRKIVDSVEGGKFFLVNNSTGFLSEGANIPKTIDTILANIK